MLNNKDKHMMKATFVILLSIGIALFGFITSDRSNDIKTVGLVVENLGMAANQDYESKYHIADEIGLRSGSFILNFESSKELFSKLIKGSEVDKKLGRLYYGGYYLIIIVGKSKEDYTEKEVRDIHSAMSLISNLDKKKVKTMIYFLNEGEGSGFHYPGSSEKFSSSVSKGMTEKFNEWKERMTKLDIMQDFTQAETMEMIMMLFVESINENLLGKKTVEEETKDFVGNNKFSSKELKQKRKEFFEKMQKDGVDAHLDELSELFAHTEYDIYVYNERSSFGKEPYFVSFSKFFTEKWSLLNQGVAYEFYHKEPKLEGKEKFYFLKQKTYEKLGIDDMVNPYDKDRASLTYALLP